MIPEKKRYAMKQKKIFAGIASMLAFSCLGRRPARPDRAL